MTKSEAKKVGRRLDSHRGKRSFNDILREFDRVAPGVRCTAETLRTYHRGEVLHPRVDILAGLAAVYDTTVNELAPEYLDQSLRDLLRSHISWCETLAA